MTYYVEAFCTSTEVPSRSEVLSWAKGRQPWFGFAPPGEQLTPEQLEDRTWDASAVFYNPDDAFVVDVYRAGEPDKVLGQDIFADLVDRFRRSVERLSQSPQRDNVLSHLERSRFVVSVGVPLSRFGDDEEAWAALSQFLDYFIERRGGLVHAEGEGFYDRNGRLIVKVD
jgi:hypothetical protein